MSPRLASCRQPVELPRINDELRICWRLNFIQQATPIQKTYPLNKKPIQIIEHSASRQDLVDDGAVARPLSQPACATKQLALTSEEAHKTGVWECTAGSYERQVVNAELMHILSGRCTFTPTGGEALKIEAGDTVFFPAHTTGRWDMQETLRKVYVVFPEA